MGAIKNLCNAYYFRTTAKRGLLLFTPQQETSAKFWDTLILIYNIDPENKEFYFIKINPDSITHYINIKFSRRVTIKLAEGYEVECLLF